MIRCTDRKNIKIYIYFFNLFKSTDDVPSIVDKKVLNLNLNAKLNPL